MKADYVEACSCHLFCACYFNKHAEHPSCEFDAVSNEGFEMYKSIEHRADVAGEKFPTSCDCG